MKHAPYGLAALSLLGAVGLAPSPAQASEIQFYVTVDLGFDRGMHPASTGPGFGARVR